MLTFQKDSIFLQFDEEKGSIHSLKDAYREYVGEEVPVFQMAILDEAGEQIRLSKEDFCFDSCKVQEDGFLLFTKIRTSMLLYMRRSLRISGGRLLWMCRRIRYWNGWIFPSLQYRVS